MGDQGEKRAASGRLLEVDPARQLNFSKASTLKLTLKNPAAAGHVAFRVKTSAPKLFVVAPFEGVLQGGANIELQITLRERHAGHGVVKFLIQAVTTSSAEALPKEKWSEFPKGAVQERCVDGCLGSQPARLTLDNVKYMK